MRHRRRHASPMPNLPRETDRSVIGHRSPARSPRSYIEDGEPKMNTTRHLLRVLLAGGGRSFQTVARQWLEKNPAVGEVVCVPTAEQAVDALDRKTVDLALVDAVLPDRDGFELTSQIKARHDAPPVALLVLYDYEAIRREAELAGADACFDKSSLTEQLAPFVTEIGERARPRIEKS